MAEMKIDAQFLLDHPFPISVVSGVANGLIYKLRGKHVPMKTATTLAAVMGIGEAILVVYEAPEKRGPVLGSMSIPSIGAWSVAGFLLGMLPFLGGEHEAAQDSAPETLPGVAPIPVLANPGASGFGYVPKKRPRRR